MSLTEPGEHGELGQVIGHGTHEPIYVRLQHGVEKAVKYHEPYVRWVVSAVNIDEGRCQYALASVRSRGEVVFRYDDSLRLHGGRYLLTFGRSKPKYVRRRPWRRQGPSQQRHEVFAGTVFGRGRRIR